MRCHSKPLRTVAAITVLCSAFLFGGGCANEREDDTLVDYTSSVDQDKCVEIATVRISSEYGGEVMYKGAWKPFPGSLEALVCVPGCVWVNLTGAGKVTVFGEDGTYLLYSLDDGENDPEYRKGTSDLNGGEIVIDIYPR